MKNRSLYIFCGSVLQWRFSIRGLELVWSAISLQYLFFIFLVKRCFFGDLRSVLVDHATPDIETGALA